MELLKIKPCDNTFFGSGDQFDFGNNNFIRSKNTPYPSVFFGAIFTAFLTLNDSFRAAFFEEGKYDHEEILRIGQVYLFNEKSGDVYIYAPKDIFMNSSEDIKFGEFEEEKSITSLSYKQILKSPKNKNFKRVSNKYISINNIYNAYLKRQDKAMNIIDESDVFIKNIKVGIGIDKSTKTVEEGKLYKIEQTEFKSNDWSYLVEYEIDYEYIRTKYNKKELKILEKGYLKLGGENKACKFEKATNEKINDFKNYYKSRTLNGNVFKVIFTSDTFFDKNIKEVFEDKLEVIGLSNDKPIFIGGFDMKVRGKKGSPRTMYKGYSAGTVILLKVKKQCNVLEEIKERMKSITSKGFNNYVILEEKI